MENNLFEIASRNLYRFPSSQGALTVEDLWSLPLTSKSGRPNLDDIAKLYNRSLKATADDESFVTEPTVNDAQRKHTQNAFELVKYIIGVRLAENRAKNEAADRAEKKQKLLALIQQKKDTQLGEKSVDELEAMLAGL